MTVGVHLRRVSCCNPMRPRCNPAAVCVSQAAFEEAQEAGLDDVVLADRAIGDTLAAVATLL